MCLLHATIALVVCTLPDVMSVAGVAMLATSHGSARVRMRSVPLHLFFLLHFLLLT